MNSERISQLKQAPPSRDSGGVLARTLRRAIELVLSFLNRLFRKRHPGDFDHEFGSWQSPDVNLTAGGNAPRPLVNRDCDKSILVYAFVSNPTPKCSLVGQLAALQQATDQVARYLRDNYRCENPDCLQEIGQTLWFGLDCGTFPGPADQGAVLVRFYCVTEL